MISITSEPNRALGTSNGSDGSNTENKTQMDLNSVQMVQMEAKWGTFSNKIVQIVSKGAKMVPKRVETFGVKLFPAFMFSFCPTFVSIF